MLSNMPWMDNMGLDCLAMAALPFCYTCRVWSSADCLPLLGAPFAACRNTACWMPVRIAGTTPRLLLPACRLLDSCCCGLGAWCCLPPPRACLEQVRIGTPAPIARVCLMRHGWVPAQLPALVACHPACCRYTD